MTAPRNPDDLIRAFLGEGETDLPDRAFDAVRSEIHRTRQRVVVGPWREPNMSIFARVAIAAVAVLAVGLAWVNFGPKQPSVGGQPTPTSSPSPSPRPLPEAFLPLEAGTYVTQSPFVARVTFTVPDGWEGNIGGPYYAGVSPAGSLSAVNFWNSEKVYADPCHFDQGFEDPPVGPSVDDLALALANSSIGGSFPTSVTVDGYKGKELTVTAPASFDGCTLSPDGFALWQLPLGLRYGMVAGQTSRFFILDVEGTRLVIDVASVPGSTAKQLGEAQAIVNSIQIEPAN